MKISAFFLTLVIFEVVFLAEQDVVPLAEVEHLAGGELFCAHGTSKAAQVIHLFSSLAYVVLWDDALTATGAFRAETPEKIRTCTYI